MRSTWALLLLASALLAHAARNPREVASAVASRETPDAAADEILELPGYRNAALPSRHYGGYITVDEVNERRLFYYFVESERDPATDPVVLWMNGGPGCSSFDGFIFEQGPFLYSLGKAPEGGALGGGEVELRPNPHAWSKVANMIFLDSPAGVGLSYSARASDYAVDDIRTAADADRFVRGWLARFPHFAGNEFFVSGESYAGIYVPNLVRQLLIGNEEGEEPAVNLKGYLVGNGCTDPRYDGNAHPTYAVGKSLIPAKAFKELEAECGGEYWNATGGSGCEALWGKLAEALTKLNIYDSLQDCFHGGPASASSSRSGSSSSSDAAASSLSGAAVASLRRGALQQQQQQRPQHHAQVVLGGEGGALLGARARASGDAAGSWAAGAEQQQRQQQLLVAEALLAGLKAEGLLGVWPLPGGAVRPGPVLNWAHVNKRLGRLGLTPPCTDSRVADVWLNDPAVRAALHAAPISLIGPWTLCSDKISYTRDHGSMIPIHINNTKGHGLRALIYSGDHDMAVPHTGSEAWTSDLGFTVKKPWTPWLVADQQVGGFFIEYEHGLTYATVKGAGHMVPETNPREALAMFERFLAGKPLA